MFYLLTIELINTYNCLGVYELEQNNMNNYNYAVFINTP